MGTFKKHGSMKSTLVLVMNSFPLCAFILTSILKIPSSAPNADIAMLQTAYLRQPQMKKFDMCGLQIERKRYCT